MLSLSRNLVLPPTDLESGTARSERQKARLEQRKRARGGLTSTREELFAGEFDGYETATFAYKLLTQTLMIACLSRVTTSHSLSSRNWHLMCPDLPRLLLTIHICRFATQLNLVTIW